MAARKLSANFIFDGKDRMIRQGILTLDSAGQVTGLKDPGDGAREEAGVEFYNGIITPGFINVHGHLELSHMKGLTERGSGLESFISTVVQGRQADADTQEEAIARADEAMQRAGIVGAGDISNTPDSFRVKAGSPIRYHTFIELFGHGNAAAGRIFRDGTALLAVARDRFGIPASLTPHSAYGLSEKLLAMIVENHRGSAVPLSIHNQESDEENTFIRSAAGSFTSSIPGREWI